MVQSVLASINRRSQTGPTLIELIKERIDIVSALEVYAGCDFSRIRLDRRKVSVRCPFHHDQSPSLSVYLIDHKFRCWAGCNNGQQGDVIDVVALSLGISKGDAVSQLAADLGLNNRGQLNQVEIQTIQEKRQRTEAKRLDAAEITWSISALQWLIDVINNRRKKIRTTEELELCADWIFHYSTIEYYLDCLLGLEDSVESDVAGIVKNTKWLIERMINEWNAIFSCEG